MSTVYEIDLSNASSLESRAAYIEYLDRVLKTLTPDGIGFDFEAAKKQLPWLRAKVCAIERCIELEKNDLGIIKITE